MYNILEVSGQDKAGNWQKPVLNYTDLKAKNYSGLYIQAHKVVKDGQWRFDDNKFLGVTQDEAKNNSFKMGLWINPEPSRLSYAKAFIDLASKVGVQDDKHLPSDASDTLLPCVMVSQWPDGQTVHQLEEDFFSYFNSILLSRYANVVLALNKSTADYLSAAIKAGSTVIANTLAKPSVRIWYLRYGLTADAMNKELLASAMKKSVWIAGIDPGVSVANWLDVVTPPVPPKPVSTIAQIKAVTLQLSELVKNLPD